MAHANGGGSETDGSRSRFGRPLRPYLAQVLEQLLRPRLAGALFQELKSKDHKHLYGLTAGQNTKLAELAEIRDGFVRSALIGSRYLRELPGGVTVVPVAVQLMDGTRRPLALAALETLSRSLIACPVRE
mgnify:CR=1 FL=1